MLYTILLLCAFRRAQGSSLVQLANNLNEVDVDEKVYELTPDLEAQWNDAFQECVVNPVCWVREAPVAKETIRRGVAKHAELKDDCLGRVLPDMGYCARVLQMHTAYVKLEDALENWIKILSMVSSLVITYLGAKVSSAYTYS